MKIKRRYWLWMAVFLNLSYGCSVFASEYYWLLVPVPDIPGTPHYGSAAEACEAIAYSLLDGTALKEYYFSGEFERVSEGNYKCLSYVRVTYVDTGYTYVVGPAYYVNKNASLIGDRCQQGKGLNTRAGKCDLPIGKPESNSCAGNPMDIGTGNKFQAEVDHATLTGSGLEFKRTYNGVDGVWRHTYSSYTRKTLTHLTVVGSVGEEYGFTLDSSIATPEATVLGRAYRQGLNWIFVAQNNDTFIYDSTDQLIHVSHADGRNEQLSYSQGVVTVTNDAGKSFTFTQDEMHQPLTLTAPGLSVQYQYNPARILTQVSATRGSQTETRVYHYEDPRDPKLLTGITDEKGVRFATWSYDDQGRAISSEHANGAERTQVIYNEDGTSTVTNSLGKKTVYHFTDVGGFRKVSAIEGEPSANCPASNSTFTYNDRGQVLTQTDAKGFITTYTYNDRGLETTRTQASGTPQARSKTTTWHATFNLPLTVTEGGQVTTYTYDTQGRQTSRTQTAL